MKGGGVAVIHKVTEALTFDDGKYRERKKAAKAAGLLWGAYHFAGDVGADGSNQADHFLRFAQPEDNDLMSFDCETHGTLKQMEDFVNRIHDVTGRLPGFVKLTTIRAGEGGRAHLHAATVASTQMLIAIARNRRIDRRESR